MNDGPTNGDLDTSPGAPSSPAEAPAETPVPARKPGTFDSQRAREAVARRGQPGVSKKHGIPRAEWRRLEELSRCSDPRTALQATKLKIELKHGKTPQGRTLLDDDGDPVTAVAPEQDPRVDRFLSREEAALYRGLAAKLSGDNGEALRAHYARVTGEVTAKLKALADSVKAEEAEREAAIAGLVGDLASIFPHSGGLVILPGKSPPDAGLLDALRAEVVRLRERLAAAVQAAPSGNSAPVASGAPSSASPEAERPVWVRADGTVDERHPQLPPRMRSNVVPFGRGNGRSAG